MRTRSRRTLLKLPSIAAPWPMFQKSPSPEGILTAAAVCKASANRHNIRRLLPRDKASQETCYVTHCR